MKNFKPETFVNGTPEECVLMLKALEIAGHKVLNTGNCNANHIWYDSDDVEWHDSSSIAYKTHELSQSELYEITRPKYWCVSRNEITDEFKEWFFDVSQISSWEFSSNYYGYNGRYEGVGQEEGIKEIPIALWRKCFYEPWLAKKQPDFSILNETDVFFVNIKNGHEWLHQGFDPTKEGKHISVAIQSGSVYKNGMGIADYSEFETIRKATPEEIEPYKEHFKFAEPAPEFDPSMPFEVSHHLDIWERHFDFYIGIDKHSGNIIVSNSYAIGSFKHIRNIQPVDVKISEIKAVQVNGELITNFKIVNE